MHFSKLKITGILSIIILALLSSCEKEYDYSLIFDESYPEQIKKEVCYCGKEPDNEIGSTEYQYDNNGNLILITSRIDEWNPTKIISSFNYSGLKLTDTIFYSVGDIWKISHIYEYNYMGSLLSKKIVKSETGEETSKTVYIYHQTKPEWEEYYYFNDGSWEFRHAIKFDFNKNRQLAKKSYYGAIEKDKVSEYYTYSYKNGKLWTEERILRTGNIGYHKEYFYNNDGTLDHVVQDENIVEENSYENGKLIEKHTWYYGIDPCFSLCCGNIIYRYEY